MQIAKCVVSLNRGHSIPLEGVTPAEALFLLYEHSDNVGGASVTDLVVTGEAMEEDGKTPRTDQSEKARLARRYVARDKQGKLEIENVFPGLNPKLPAKFEDVEFEQGYPFRKGGVGVSITPVPLREDGPTFEEFVAKGYSPMGYPPEGYAERPSDGLTAHKKLVEDAVKAAYAKQTADRESEG